jgi:hypothetical protein
MSVLARNSKVRFRELEDIAVAAESEEAELPRQSEGAKESSEF